MRIGIMFRLAAVAAVSFVGGCATGREGRTMPQAGERFSVETVRDAETGWDVIVLRREGDGPALEARVVPAAGMNAYSLKRGDTELLKTPDALSKLPDTPYGIPVLYPTPNRVRDARFTFGGRTFAFPPNERTHFLHGLVHTVAWEAETPVAAPDGASVTGRVRFQPGSELHERFPIDSTLSLTVTLERDGLRIAYRVENHDKSPLPFGFALHPWFLYLSERKDTYVRVPATHHMATEQSPAYRLLPTGKLDPLDGHALDMRRPRTLEGFVIDDVFFGMRPDKPAGYEDRATGTKVTLSSSADFTHMVVYTPKNQPWFCMENQTCATDAHNLHAKGQTEAAHLQIVAPGQAAEGWVKLTVEP